ncbi:hypothetical protein [Conyzicola sp.]|uniref:hypothetical protein n=1 Tax=Conyzicola sp. TaxID=1969404 RepID=UPI0039891613
MDWDTIVSTLLGSLLSGTVIVVFVRLAALHWETNVQARITSAVEDEFKKIVETRDADRALLNDVLGPVCGNLARTKQAFNRWRDHNPTLEVKVIAESNGVIRQTILTKYHLIPAHLQGHAMDLVGHYDKWFEVFDTERNSGKPEASQAKFIFAGTHGVPFPHEAEEAFRDELKVVTTRLRPAAIDGQHA